MVNLLTADVADVVGAVQGKVLDYLFGGVRLISILLFSYIVGFAASVVLKRVLLITEWRDLLVRYGAMSGQLWESTVKFLSQYVKWFAFLFLVDAFLVSKTESAAGVAYSFPVIHDLLVLTGNIFWFILLAVFGVMLGGVAAKFARDFLAEVGLEKELERHKLENVLGEPNVSDVLAGILRWYVIILFVAQGVAKLTLPQLTAFMDGLVAYIPNAILGLLMLLASLLVGGYLAANIKASKTFLKDLAAPAVNALVVYFGVVLALPKFGIADVSILVDAFRIFALGLALATGIALGWGLKDTVARLAERQEKGL